MATNPGIGNLVSWWSMDESSGNRSDSHGSNTLTQTGTVGSATGKVGNCAVLENGENLAISDNASLSFVDDAFTIGGWFYWDTVPASGNVDTLLGKWNYGANQREYQLSYNRDGSYDLWMQLTNAGNNDGTTCKSGVGVISPSTWYFVVGGHDPVLNIVWISVNGAAKITAAHTLGCRDGTSSFMIGANNEGANFQLLGRTDECFAFNKSLTDDEISWLYNGGSGRTYADLVPSSAISQIIII